MSETDRDDEPRDVGLGLGRALLTLLGVHLEHAREEASSDGRRVLRALLLLVVALVLLVFALVSLQALAVVSLHDALGFTWAGALAVSVGVDFAGMTLLLVAARARLSEPVLVRTRALVRRTVDALREP
ncbi:MAG: phage holin family protein [Deltaproteobacteria bacterium]|nr:phage holin family protein [Deltaproteobacteria bacterium]